MQSNHLMLSSCMNKGVPYLLTRLMRGRDNMNKNVKLHYAISTHTPHAGRDRNILYKIKAATPHFVHMERKK